MISLPTEKIYITHGLWTWAIQIKFDWLIDWKQIFYKAHIL